MTGRQPQMPRPRNGGRWAQPVIRIGDVIRVEEGNHRCGPGRLVLEVIEVGRREHRDGDLWLHLRGVEISQPDGVRLCQRRALVRLASVVVQRGPNRLTRSPVPGTPEAHVPQRPRWQCAGCGQDWPCPDRRSRLSAEYAGNRIALAVLLASYMIDALTDRPDLSPADLRTRFLGWLPRRR